MSQITSVLSAMGQQTRLDILRLLSGAPDGGVTSGGLAAKLEVPLNSMSTHLAVLLRAGLVRAERSGRNVLYRIRRDRAHEAVSDLSALLSCPREGGRAGSEGGRPPADPDMECVLARTLTLTSIDAAAARRWSEMKPPRMDEVRASLGRISDLNKVPQRTGRPADATWWDPASDREARKDRLAELAG